MKIKLIDERGISVTEAAKALGVARPSLSKLINQRVHLSPEMAVRLEKAFGFPLEAMMQMQTAFDIAEARKKNREIEVQPFQFVGTTSMSQSANREAVR
ncbi:HigA family addiction module antitoxin [Qipengyuania sp.]|uniref:HigA family addiction module antitoxin n=1 Tax=Qipengyuania sp. TaxID=2004515 RepID=UPI001F3E9C40